MRILLLITLFMAVGAPAPARAQDFERIPLRVISTERNGDVIVDRGERDLVRPGDEVVLRPRTGGTLRGRVAEVAERSARIRLFPAGETPIAGTRGEVLVPTDRRQVPVPEAPPPPPEQEAPVHPPWANQDEEWTPDQPLLSEIRAVRPEERPTNLTGRVYWWSHETWTTIDDRGNGFHRLGTDLEWENPFERGGSLHLDGELNYRHADIPDQADENFSKLRLDRFSYRMGGTRFERDRIEFGRFLQTGLPEFGALDGGEWIRRLGNHDRFGVSMGFMPVPDPDLETFRDFQFASFYEFVADEEERFVFTGGLQKTWHDGDADRDLMVAKLRYDPAEGWDLYGAAWVDYYTSGDAKGPGFEVTQAIVSTTRSWDRNGLGLAYDRQRFPDIDRFEFLPPDPNEIFDDRYDRVLLNAWHDFSGGTRLLGEVGYWDDEDDNGFLAELGVSYRNLFFDRSYTDLALYVTDGRFNTVGGGRVSMGRYTERGRWNLSYEISNNELEGFAFDDILQHRLRLGREHRFANGWSLSLWGEGHVFDDEGAWTVGVALEKSF